MSVSAPVFDIKHYAVHDGPGIRSTFFLQGCILRCIWCQNPESISRSQTIAFIQTKCIKCGMCKQVCEKLDDSMRLPRTECSLCGKCVHVCPTKARKFQSKLITPHEVLEIAQQQKTFYDISRGGVTFSGGECMLHPKFMKAALGLLRDAGIHTTVDTCGAVPWSYFQDVLPVTDLFLFDMKIVDSALHKQFTGSDNHLILENLKQLVMSGAEVIVRVPLIPGITDNLENIQAIGRYVNHSLCNRIQRLELLPYNQLAESKYGNNTIWTDGGVGAYSLPGLETQANAYVEQLQTILSDMGIKVYAESK